MLSPKSPLALNRWLAGIAFLLLLVAACVPEGPTVITAPPLPTLVTTHVVTSTTTSSASSIGPTTTSAISPTTTSSSDQTPTTATTGRTVLLPNVFAAPEATAVEALEEIGLVVIAYNVCSGSVEAGEVRQVVLADGTPLVDKEGVTAVGSALPLGTVVEVKIGTGSPCG